jgi:hypothetical protein
MQSSLQFKPRKDLDVYNLSYPKGKVIAIGDVHGCKEELNELIGKLDLYPGDTEDLVVFLGDLVDRGPYSEEVVQTVRTLSDSSNTYCVVSNHDEKVARYHYHHLKGLEDPNYKTPMRPPKSYPELSESSLAFLNRCPHAVFVSNEGTAEPYPLCFVHAGLSPALFKQPPAAFVRNRYFTKNVKENKLTPVKSVEIDDIWYVPEGSHPWYHYWDGRWTVLFGHSVYWSPLIENNCIGIDGGCCFGGVLRAWVKEPGKSSYFVDVPSKKRYTK